MNNFGGGCTEGRAPTAKRFFDVAVVHQERSDCMFIRSFALSVVAMLGFFVSSFGCEVTPCEPVDDNDPCTQDTCEQGLVVHVPVADGLPCDDGDSCTVIDACKAGICTAGDPKICPDGTNCGNGACPAYCPGMLGFPDRPLIPVGADVKDIVAADFNGDLQIDIATANSDDTVSILQNTGHFTFAPRVDYSFAAPIAMAGGDFNGDNVPDLVVTDGWSLRILLNKGDGTFDVSMAQPLAGSVFISLVAADFNGDGRTDVAVVARSSPVNIVTTLLSDGNGGFSSIVTQPLSYDIPIFMSAADMNGDGRPELVMSTWDDLFFPTTSRLSVLGGNGDGTFASPIDLDVSTTLFYGRLAAVDINGDAAADLVAAQGDDMRVFLNQGDGTPALPVDYIWPPNVDANLFFTADVNGDGALDVVAPDVQYVHVLLNDGKGTYSPPASYTAPLWPNWQSPNQIAAVDLNGDGALDLVGRHSGALVTIENLGDGTFVSSLRTTHATDPGPWSIVAADFNHDGLSDVAVGTVSFKWPPPPNPEDTVDIFLNDGNGTFPTAPALRLQGFNGVGSMDAGDVNGDGAVDLVVAEQYHATVSVWLNDGNGGFSQVGDYMQSDWPHSVLLGDFNGDGYSDMVVNIRNTNTVRMLLNDGTGAFAFHADYSTGGNLAGGAAADLNNDGLLDLAVASDAGFALEVRLNQGGGVLGFASVIPLESLPVYPSTVIAEDLNHDGYADLAATYGLGVQVSLNMGGGQFAAAQAYPVGSYSKSIVAGDFNGDSETDLAVVGGYMLLLLNEGDGTFSQVIKYDGGESPYALAKADFNGDDKLDLVIADRTASEMSVNLSTCWP